MMLSLLRLVRREKHALRRGSAYKLATNGILKVRSRHDTPNEFNSCTL